MVPDVCAALHTHVYLLTVSSAAQLLLKRLFCKGYRNAYIVDAFLGF
jgi:hypothetical protein